MLTEIDFESLIKALRVDLDDSNFIDLKEMAEWIFNNNPTKAIYHGNEHLYGVAAIALALYRANPTADKLDRVYRLGHEIILVVAALWHDFGHSAGHKPDKENIELAIDSFNNYVSAHPRFDGFISGIAPFISATRQDVFDSIHRAIRCTEYTDGKFPISPFDLVQCSLRDADILYTFDPKTTGRIAHELYQELYASGNYRADYSEFLQAQRRFHAGVEMSTMLGEQIHSSNLEKVLEAQYEWARQYSHIAQGTTRTEVFARTRYLSKSFSFDYDTMRAASGQLAMSNYLGKLELGVAIHDSQIVIDIEALERDNPDYVFDVTGGRIGYAHKKPHTLTDSTNPGQYIIAVSFSINYGQYN